MSPGLTLHPPLYTGHRQRTVMGATKITIDIHNKGTKHSLWFHSALARYGFYRQKQRIYHSVSLTLTLHGPSFMYSLKSFWQSLWSFTQGLRSFTQNLRSPATVLGFSPYCSWPAGSRLGRRRRSFRPGRCSRWSCCSPAHPAPRASGEDSTGQPSSASSTTAGTCCSRWRSGWQRSAGRNRRRHCRTRCPAEKI